MNAINLPPCLLLLNCENTVPVDLQDRRVGGPCEGCEATMEFADRSLRSVETLPGAGIDAPALYLTGTVFQNDGITPTGNVVVYIHHTDQMELYRIRDDAEEWRNNGEWARRHGSLRSWVRTDSNGQYTFITQRPAPYPGSTDPEHIHIFVKEDGLQPYYIDDVVFEDDPLLTDTERGQRPDRGGSGIVRPESRNDTIFIRRDIILGRNIPGY